MSEEEITFTRKEVEEMLEEMYSDVLANTYSTTHNREKPYHCYYGSLTFTYKIIKKYIEKKLTPETYTLSEIELKALLHDTRLYSPYEGLNEFIERAMERIKDKFKGENK